MNLKIANYFGIPLYINILIVPFALWIYLARGELGTFSLAVFIISLFFVLLHEYGHCFMAMWYKWKVMDITILPIGGVAQIVFRHNTPWTELMVAIAGPAVSFFFVCLFLPLVILFAYLGNNALCFLFTVPFTSNAIILLFNLLPIFPMDGGRVLRALLAYKLGHEKATWWAVRIGQFGGVGMGITACYYGLWFAGIILMFMTLVSQNELAQARLLTSLYRLRRNIAIDLNKPELDSASLPELIATLEAIEDKDLREKVQADEILPLLRDVNQSNVVL